tara:strand:+ start:377 stop:790 length:414 start_codon:yes stop_codon:yes gene_type:complete
MLTTFKKDILKGYHDCVKSNYYGDWRLFENINHIDLERINYLLTETQTLNHEDIAWKGMDLPEEMVTNECICCDGLRYLECNIKYPCIVLNNAVNPHNKKYRLIDGKHRMAKMRKQGITSSKFYVLELNNLPNVSFI